MLGMYSGQPHNVALPLRVLHSVMIAGSQQHFSAVDPAGRADSFFAAIAQAGATAGFAISTLIVVPSQSSNSYGSAGFPPPPPPPPGPPPGLGGSFGGRFSLAELRIAIMSCGERCDGGPKEITVRPVTRS